MKIKDCLHSRRLQYGAFSVLVTAAFLVLIVLVNLLASMIADRFPTDIDLTANHAFALSDQTVEFLDTLDKDVEITVFVSEKQMDTAGGYYTQAKKIIDNYVRHSRKVHVTYVDPVKNPNFAAAYPDQKVNYNDILVACGSHVEKISFTDFFNAQYTQSGVSIVSSRAEQEMTAAILRATANEHRAVTLLTGHGETYSESLRSLLHKNGYEVTEQDLMTEEISRDADLVMMIGTSRDVDTTAAERLDAYLTNDGKYGKNLIFAPSVNYTQLPVLDQYLARWGIRYQPDMILESDSRNVANNLSHFCLVNYTSRDYAQELDPAVRVVSIMGKQLQTLFENNSGHSVTPLLDYAPSSVHVPADATEDWRPTDENKGVHHAVVRSEYVRMEEGKALRSRVFALASALVFDDSVLTSQSVANGDYFLSLINTSTNNANAIRIAPKNLEVRELAINQLQFYILGAVFVIVIPLAILGGGTVVWMRRKNR